MKKKKKQKKQKKTTITKAIRKKKREGVLKLVDGDLTMRLLTAALALIESQRRGGETL